jgi:hypothetical protein
MDTDETGGWIFSDAYHAWQDGQIDRTKTVLYRPGNWETVKTMGWWVGLFTIRGGEPAMARWPRPMQTDDLGA